MKTTLTQLGEFGLIDSIKEIVFDNDPRKTTADCVIQGIGDDAAVVTSTKSGVQLLTTDMVVEDIHFTRDMLPENIGHKVLACSISDIAAMGGIPKYAVVSIAVPKKLEVEYVKKIYEGMNNLAKKFGVYIVGGDTVKSSKIVINVALTGDAQKSSVVYRRGAKKGDQIYVTGVLGNSFDSGHHCQFVPRLAEAQYLVENFKPSSMIDISDGMGRDLFHITEKSNVGAVLFEDKIPLRSGADIEMALYDGEDFELVFTLSPQNVEVLRKKRKAKYPFYHIGEITREDDGIKIVSEKGEKKELLKKGYIHF